MHLSQCRLGLVTALVCLVLCALFAPTASALDTSTRSAAEIRQRWTELRPDYIGGPYAVAPSISAPYAAGALQPGFLADGLDAINYARYLAGLPDDIVLDPELNDLAQHGAVLVAASEFSHTPSQPPDMEDAFYQRGYRATSSSNLGWGYSDLASFNFGCMEDSDSSNIQWLGHRRWLLFPALARTGMGYAESRTDTYVFDWSRPEPVDYDAVLWPCAGYFPVEQFSELTAWSITLNPDRYTLGASGQQVTLRRLGDGRMWTFTAADSDKAGEYFTVGRQGFGVDNCIIFRPDPDAVSAYSVGDSFEVTLSGGVYEADGVTSTSVSYTTTFMSQEAALQAATVSRPHTPSSPRHRRLFTAWGYLEPRHVAGTKAVTLYCSRRSNGAWSVRKTVRAALSDYAGYSRYSVRMSLPSAGRWRLRACHADAGHCASWSAWRYLTVW